MPWYLMELHPARSSFPSDATQDEQQVIGEHFDRLAEQTRTGRILLVGRTQERTDPLGLCVFEAADQQAADDFVAADPAVSSGIFTGAARPYQPVLGSPEALARSLRGQD